MISVLALALVTAAPPESPMPPCLRLARAGTQVQGSVTVCPGRYRIADPTEIGVLIVAGSGTRVDLTGVTLESGDTAAHAFVGIGIASRGVDNVEIYGGVVRGYRYGIRLEGGRGHRITRVDVSGSRRQALRSTPERYDERDWLDIFRPDSFEPYGGGILLKSTDGATITSVTARNGQNGIGLFGARGSYLGDNDVSENSGWGIHLWRASHNVIVRNRAHHNVRCESPVYRRGCDSAGILLREQSDSNLIADNNLTWSGDGFFLSGHRPYLHPSVGNVVLRNDASFAYHNGFEATFSPGNVFVENRADSADYGFWLGYSTGTTVHANTVLGSRLAGIAIEHGSANTISDNVIIGGEVGIHLFAADTTGPASRDYLVSDNVLAEVARGVVLERTSGARVRGNTFDGVEDGIVADSAARDAQVTGNLFLRAQRWFISAPELTAGSNFWATRTAEEARARVNGRITIVPWLPAAALGY